MATLSDLVKISSQSSKRFIPDPTDDETSPSLISGALSGLMDIGLTAMDALDYVAAIPRAGLGQLMGIEGTGRETFLGSAPSGRELLGLGGGKKGKFELADIPGFAAELVLDPTMYLGIGAATKAGQAASRARNLATKITVAKARLPAASSKKALKASLEEIAENTKALEKLGYKSVKDVPEYGRLGAQAAAGERSLLSLDVPFTGINTPLSVAGGRISEQVLGLLGKGGHAITLTPGIRQAITALRPGGRKGIEAYEHLTPDVLRKIATVNEEINASQALMRGTRNIGPRLIQKAFAKLDNAPELKYSHFERVGAEVKTTERLTETIGHYDEAVAIDNMHYSMEFENLGGKLQDVDDKLEVAKNSQIGVKGQQLKTADRTVRKLQKERDKLLSKQEQLGYKHKAQQERILATAARKLAPANEALMNSRAAIDRIGPELTQRIRTIHAAQGEALETSISMGVQVGDLADPHLMYMHRAIERDARTLTSRILGEQDDFGRLAYAEETSKQGFTRPRVEGWEGIDVPTINDMWRDRMEAGLDDMLANAEKAGDPNGISLAKQARRDYEKIKDKGYFSEHATESILKRYTQGARADAAAAHWNGAIKLHALPKETAGHGAVPVEDVIQKGAKDFGVFADKAGMGTDEIAAALKGTALEGQYIPKDIVDAMTRTSTAMKEPEALSDIIRFADKVNSIYRFWATQFFPSFHARNAASNVFMTHLAGMRNPMWFARAAKKQSLAKKGDEAAIKLMDEAIKHGSLGRSQVQEIAELLGKDVTSRIATGGRIGEWAAKRGSTIEDNAKLAMYMWAKESKGLTSSEAGDLVKKYLFDYEDLSKFEKKYLRRGAFFYTYARKSMPLLVEEMLMKPRRLSMYGHTTGDVGSRRDQREILPPWVRERMPFGFTNDAEGNQRFLKTGLPPENLLQFSSEGRGVQRVFQKIAGMTAPTIRLPIEYLTGVKLATGLPQKEPSGLLQKVVEAAPPALRKQISQLGRLESALPTARGTSAIKRIAEAIIGERGWGSTALSLGVGLTTKDINPQEQSIRNRLRKINMALENSSLISEGHSQRSKDLRSLRAKLSRRLREMK